eukprot:ctg_675.g332
MRKANRAGSGVATFGEVLNRLPPLDVPSAAAALRAVLQLQSSDGVEAPAAAGLEGAAVVDAPLRMPARVLVTAVLEAHATGGAGGDSLDSDASAVADDEVIGFTLRDVVAAVPETVRRQLDAVLRQLLEDEDESVFLVDAVQIECLCFIYQQIIQLDVVVGFAHPPPGVCDVRGRRGVATDNAHRGPASVDRQNDHRVGRLPALGHGAAAGERARLWRHAVPADRLRHPGAGHTRGARGAGGCAGGGAQTGLDGQCDATGAGAGHAAAHVSGRHQQPQLGGGDPALAAGEERGGAPAGRGAGLEGGAGDAGGGAAVRVCHRSGAVGVAPRVHQFAQVAQRSPARARDGVFGGVPELSERAHFARRRHGAGVTGGHRHHAQGADREREPHERQHARGAGAAVPLVGQGGRCAGGVPGGYRGGGQLAVSAAAILGRRARRGAAALRHPQPTGRVPLPAQVPGSGAAHHRGTVRRPHPARAGGAAVDHVHVAHALHFGGAAQDATQQDAQVRAHRSERVQGAPAGVAAVHRVPAADDPFEAGGARDDRFSGRRIRTDCTLRQDAGRGGTAPGPECARA